MSLISEVLMLNPHSVHTLNHHKKGLYAIRLDNLEIVYEMDEAHEKVQVIEILRNDLTKPQEKLRTKEWLDKTKEKKLKIEESK